MKGGCKRDDSRQPHPPLKTQNLKLFTFFKNIPNQFFASKLILKAKPVPFGFWNILINIE